MSKHIPTDEDVVNPIYYTVNDSNRLSNNPVKEPIRCHAEVTVPTEVKMKANPAYAVP